MYTLILHINLCTLLKNENRIDTAMERFRCQFRCTFSWLPTIHEWKDFESHKQRKNLAQWRPHWIPTVAFPELVTPWKLHFAEKPTVGKFWISALRSGFPEDDIGYDKDLTKFIRCKLECDLVCFEFLVSASSNVFAHDHLDLVDCLSAAQLPRRLPRPAHLDP